MVGWPTAFQPITRQHIMEGNVEQRKLFTSWRLGRKREKEESPRPLQQLPPMI
jgi:hypothetical protein